MTKIAVVGGTSLLSSTLFSHLQPNTVCTPHGNVVLHTHPDSPNLVFLQRHHANADAGTSVYHPPHRINHRANFHALASLQVDAVLAVCSVGSLQPRLSPGTLVIPDDYFYLFGPSFSQHDDDRGHIVPTLDPHLRSLVSSVLHPDPRFQKLADKDVVYVQTVGPRFETPAEVRFLSTMGDVVGMTAANEATCAKELNLPYAILGMIDNMGNGLAESSLTKEQFDNTVKRNQHVIESAVTAVLERLLQHKF